MSDVKVLIPNVNRFDLLNRQLENLAEYTHTIDLILVDNGSDDPSLLDIPDSPVFNSVTKIYFDENEGCLPPLRVGEQECNPNDILVFMHNDVLLWEHNWDDRVRAEFSNRATLGLAGLFGAPGVAADGGRMFARSNMIGKEWGTEGILHGHIFGGTAPAAVLDSMCMMFRVSSLRAVGIPDDWPPHHWFDRLFCARFIEKGWDVAIIGIAFDHYGGGSSGKVMDDFAVKWAKRKGHDMNLEEANAFLYAEGLRIWDRDYAHRMTLISDSDWNYSWSRK